MTTENRISAFSASPLIQRKFSLADVENRINALCSIPHTIDDVQDALEYWCDLYSALVHLEERICCDSSVIACKISVPVDIRTLKERARRETNKFSELLTLHSAKDLQTVLPF